MTRQIRGYDELADAITKATKEELAMGTRRHRELGYGQVLLFLLAVVFVVSGGVYSLTGSQGVAGLAALGTIVILTVIAGIVDRVIGSDDYENS